jgi:hypothetical protein
VFRGFLGAEKKDRHVLSSCRVGWPLCLLAGLAGLCGDLQEIAFLLILKYHSWNLEKNEAYHEMWHVNNLIPI